MRKLVLGLSASALALLAAPVEAQTPLVVRSPDGANVLRVDIANGLHYDVARKGQPVLASSPIGLFTSQGPIGGGAVNLLSAEESKVDQLFVPVAGKASRIAERYNQTVFHLARTSDGFRFDLIARAYPDGVAFRLSVPQQAGLTTLDVNWETTGFYFPADYGCWGANSGTYDNSHEFEFDAVQASKMRNFHLYDAPLVCRTANGTTFALTDADKRDYTGTYYRGRGDAGLGVNVALTTRRDNPQDSAAPKVSARASLLTGPMQTAWRVVMLGDTPGNLIESNLVPLLAEPSRVADTSWIKPGKSAWDWWNGWAVDVPNAGINTATYKAYIDFAERMKLDYILIDEGWYKGSSEGPRPADVTVPIAAMNIPEIVRYAGDRKIGVWVWLQWKQLERQLDDALALYEAWGIKGIKVDFMDRNDQDMVAFYHRVLETAAKHHLMVDLHGAYPPDGLARTYPNYLTQEGVLGAEYNKFGARITATHNVTLPFTRMLLGPMDYTPGGFRSLTPAEFAGQVRSKRPFVQTTRGQALAMYVVYDSPLAMVADSPDAYVRADGTFTSGADFLRDVPTSWDETRVLSGEIGQYIVIARRKGARWYVGAMSNEQSRTLSVPLNFLPVGAFTASVYEDGAERNSVRQRAVKAGSATKLTLKLAAGGGAVATIEPASEK